MKVFLLTWALCFFAPVLRGQTSSGDSLILYVFLQEECVICQYYTLTLRQLHEQFGDHVRFIGVFPSRSSKKKKMAAFKKKYQLPFELKTDVQQILTKKMGARITPEAVIFNVTTDEILYRGRLDDAYAEVGRRRSVVTASELRDALDAILENREVLVKRTQAVGCFIELLR